MTDKQLAEIVCAALMSIIVAIRKKYNLKEYHGVNIVLQPTDTLSGITEYDSDNVVK